MRDERSEIVCGAFISKVLTLQKKLKGQRIVSDAGFVVVFVWRGLEQFQLLCMSPE